MSTRSELIEQAAARGMKPGTAKRCSSRDLTKFLATKVKAGGGPGKGAPRKVKAGGGPGEGAPRKVKEAAGEVTTQAETPKKVRKVKEAAGEVTTQAETPKKVRKVKAEDGPVRLSKAARAKDGEETTGGGRNVDLGDLGKLKNPPGWEAVRKTTYVSFRNREGVRRFLVSNSGNRAGVNLPELGVKQCAALAKGIGAEYHTVEGEDGERPPRGGARVVFYDEAARAKRHYGGTNLIAAGLSPEQLGRFFELVVEANDSLAAAAGA